MSMLLRRLSSSLRSLSLKVGKHQECNVIIVGLDNSGKSTVINYLQKNNGDGEVEETAPTVGYRVETFRRKNLRFTAYDMSGQGKYRNLWEKQYSQVNAIIFVIDSTDQMRMCVARDELEMLLEHQHIRTNQVPVLFLANKMDHPDHIPPSECISSLGLEGISDRPWFIVATNARTGEGISEAFDWLSDTIDGGREESKK